MSKYGVFSGPYFLVFGLNTERYEVSLCIQFECGKTQNRKNSVFGHISHSESNESKERQYFGKRMHFQISFSFWELQGNRDVLHKRYLWKITKQVVAVTYFYFIFFAINKRDSRRTTFSPQLFSQKNLHHRCLRDDNRAFPSSEIQARY